MNDEGPGQRDGGRDAGDAQSGNKSIFQTISKNNIPSSVFVFRKILNHVGWRRLGFRSLSCSYDFYCLNIVVIDD